MHHVPNLQKSLTWGAGVRMLVGPSLLRDYVCLLTELSVLQIDPVPHLCNDCCDPQLPLLAHLLRAPSPLSQSELTLLVLGRGELCRLGVAQHIGGVLKGNAGKKLGWQCHRTQCQSTRRLDAGRVLTCSKQQAAAKTNLRTARDTRSPSQRHRQPRQFS
jgi:hypothetical protein